MIVAAAAILFLTGIVEAETMQWQTKEMNGARSISVTTDVDNAVVESKEDNNTQSRSYTLQDGRVQ